MYAVQGYDAGLLLSAGLTGARGDIGDRKAVIEAMRRARIDSPRGSWRLSKTHNPVQDQYLRKVAGRENRIVGVATRALDDDPGVIASCRMPA